MWLLNRYLPIIELISTPWNKIGFALIIAGLCSDGTSLIQFFSAHTTVNPLHPERTEKLVKTGTYRFTRNPMYVGLLLLLTGWGVLLGSLSPFIMLPVFIWVMTIGQIIPEEKILEQKFGQQYLDYKLAVKRWL
jgi:protein-S-isoprenylcysteine O-methyltransferase Ste14